jgi:hypothetical protein
MPHQIAWPNQKTTVDRLPEDNGRLPVLRGDYPGTASSSPCWSTGLSPHSLYMISMFKRKGVSSGLVGGHLKKWQGGSKRLQQQTYDARHTSATVTTWGSPRRSHWPAGYISLGSHRRWARSSSANELASQWSGSPLYLRDRGPSACHYSWTGHKPGSGLSGLTPSILHYNWFWDNIC